ncbi:hypothetical protein F0U59_18575 [Archangium gephyra]|nr:hypothetical protein F0U59_18575 [Archangium gephyra]
MARWFPQSVSPSVSKGTRQRTAYLDPLLPRINDSIRDYLAQHPDGEEVTLAVLRALGRDLLVSLQGEEKLDRTKQDVGLKVAICLVDLFGASRVLTFRENDGKAPSTRDAKRAGLDWVARYTPHRVLPLTSEDRIVLDTNTVRYILQGSKDLADVLDLQQLARLKGHRKVSLADPAWAELVKALAKPDGGLTFEEWSGRVDALNAVLDPELPIVPSGRESTHMAGIEAMPGFDIGRMSAYYRALWHYTSSTKDASDWAKPYTFEYPDGTRAAVGPFDPERVFEVFDAHAHAWAEFIASAQRGEPTSLQALVDKYRADLARDFSPQAVDRLSLVIQATAHFEMSARAPRTPYKAKPNDAVDLDILYCVTLPAILCTAEKRLVNIVRSTTSSDAWRVMRPKQLLEWLESQASKTA